MTEGLPHDQSPTRHAQPSDGWFFRFDGGSFQRVLLSAIAIVMIVAALSKAGIIVVPTLLAILCAVALTPLARRLESIGAPATLSAVVIVVMLLAGAGTALYALSPSTDAFTERAPEILREVERRVRSISAQLSIVGNGEGDGDGTTAASPVSTGQDSVAAAETGEEASEDDTVSRLVDGGQRLMADVVIGAPGLAAAAAYWAVLTVFMLRDRAMLSRSIMRLGYTTSTRRALGRAMRDVRTDVARYLLAITLINCGVGLCTALAFTLLGVENAVMWGVANAVLSFMPFIGPAIMALVTLGVGIVSFADPLVAFAPLVAVLAINALEGNVVTPTVVGARLRLPAIAPFVAIAFAAWLWGVAGALVATPTLIVAVAFVRRLTEATNGRSRSSGDVPRGRRRPPVPIVGGAGQTAVQRGGRSAVRLEEGDAP